MSDITCPRCALTFEPTALMRAEIEERLRSDLAAEWGERDAELRRRAREVEERERGAALTLEERLAAASVELRARAEAEAEARHAARTARAVADLTQELDAARAHAAAARDAEAQLLRRARALEEREAEVALEVERRLSNEAQAIRARVEAQTLERTGLERQAAALREQEHQVQIAQLRRTIEELNRQSMQGSQQLQGEAQEASLRELLQATFPLDELVEVAQGVRGADLLQRVRDERGTEAGTILWESKRTRAYSEAWLAKLRDDQRRAGAALAVLVTQALPAGVVHFAHVDGIWVCGWGAAAALAMALRAGLVELAAARRAADRRGDKAELVYDYLTGPEFKNRISGVVEAFRELQNDLAAERRAMEKLWRQREKQLLRAQLNLAACWGDLRGLAGRQLPAVDALELDGHLPEDSAVTSDGAARSDDLDPSEDPQGLAADATAPTELVGLLYSLLPEDGGAVANGELAERFTRAAADTLGVRTSAADFDRCRDTLVDRGLARRGRGGVVARRVATPVVRPATQGTLDMLGVAPKP